MYSFDVLIFSLLAWIYFPLMDAKHSSLETNVNLEPCNEENNGRRELVRDMNGKEDLFICSKYNQGVYTWTKKLAEVEIDNKNEIMDDIMLKREAATEFFERDRRDLKHECYTECCSWEEVREHYKHDISAARWYWKKFLHWKKYNTHCRRKGGWTW